MDIWVQKLAPRPVLLVVGLQVTSSNGLLSVAGVAASEVPSVGVVSSSSYLSANWVQGCKELLILGRVRLVKQLSLHCHWIAQQSWDLTLR